MKMEFASLNAGNYVEWAARFKGAVSAKGWEDALTSAASQHSSKVKGLMVNKVDSEYIRYVDQAATAKAAWDDLKQLHQQSSSANRVQLLEQFSSLQMQPDESVLQYTSRSRQIADSLDGGAASRPTEEFLVAMVLKGLPSEYDTFRTVVENSTLPNMTELVTKLQLEEHKIASRKPISKEMSFFGSNRGRGTQRSNGRGWSRGRSRDHRRSSSSDSQGSRQHSHSRERGERSDRRFRCRHCHKPGHKEAECWQLHPEQRPRDQQRRQHNDQEYTFTAGEELGFDADAWIFDSGSSKHTSFNESLFYRLEPLQETVSITYGNGKQLSAQGIGTIKFRQAGKTVHIRDVLYVPGSTVNLLSMKQLAVQKDVELAVSSNHITVYKSGREVFRVSDQKGLWVLQDVQYIQPEHRSELGLAAVPTAADWHSRLGHLSYGGLAKLAAGGMADGLNISAAEFTKAGEGVCDVCQLSKQPQLPFEAADSSTSRPLELLHSDLMGPISPPSRNGEKYLLTLLDDYTGLSVVVALKNKTQVLAAMQEQISMLETQSGQQLKEMRTDNGTEYVNDKVLQYLRAKGVVDQHSMPHTPQQNGKAERLNRTLQERVRAMLIESAMSNSYWAEAAVMANVLKNRSPAGSRPMTPVEMFTGKKPDLSRLQPFGAVAYATIPKELRRSKLDAVSVRGRLVGYASMGAGYRIALPDGRVIRSRHVVFGTEPAAAEPPAAEVAPKHVTFMLGSDDSDEEPAATAAGGQSGADAAPGATAAAGQPGSSGESSQPVGASGAVTRAAARAAAADTARSAAAANSRPIRSAAGVPHPRYAPYAMSAMVDADSYSIPEPATYREAMESKHSEQWKQGCDDEIASLHQNNTWTLVDIPPGVDPIDLKWVFKVKRDGSGQLERFKARVVAKGFMQQEGIDFDEVYAPVSKYTTFRSLMAIAAAEDLEIQQLDVKTAFLQGELAEQVYVNQPEGYEEGGPGKCYLLHKAIYGLKQAPRTWHQRLHAELSNLGLTASEADAGLYTYNTKQESIYLLVYVDDILLISSSKPLISSVKQSLMSAFDVRDLGDATTFLGINIIRDRRSKSIRLIQQRLIGDTISKFGLADAKPASVPMSSSVKLSKEEGAPLNKQAFPYGQLVGTLNYLAVCTRPDIAYAVGALSRYLHSPTTVHGQAARTVGRYLKGTADFGISYGSSSTSSSNGSNIKLEGYCDSDYAGDLDTRRSTTGYVFTLNGGPISWQSKRQPTVAVSTAEAEYIAAAAAVKEALWLAKLMADLGYPQMPVPISGDNQAALKLLRNPISSLRSKHIDVVHHFARERVMRGEIQFSYISTADQLADFLTKAVPPAKHSMCCKNLSIGKVI